MLLCDLFEAAGSDIAPGTHKSKKVKLKDGRTLVLTIEYTTRQYDPYDGGGTYPTVGIEAHIDGRLAGHARLYQNTHFKDDWEARFQNSWTASDLQVYSEYHRLGIATEMYAFATACGMRIIRSGEGVGASGKGKLLPDGQSFWDAQRPPYKLGQKPKPAPDFWRRPRKPTDRKAP